MNNKNNSISLSDFNTSHKPSVSHDYLGDPKIQKLDKDIYSISYITDDSVPYVGDLELNIFNSDSEEFEDALCINSYGDEMIDMTLNFESRLRATWIDHAVQSVEFISYCEDEFDMNTEDVEAKAKDLAEQVFDENIDSTYFSDMFEFGYEAQKELFDILREEGEIGAKYAVMLDVYRHSGESWSISGQGMNCRWDTSRGEGAFIPDQDQVEWIENNGDNYAFGNVSYSYKDKSWHAYLDDEFGGEDSHHKSYHEANTWLKEKVKEYDLKADPDQIAQGRYRMSCNLAEQSLDTYNDILAGNVYGVCNEIHKIESDGVSTILAEDTTWGFIGDSVYESIDDYHFESLPSDIKKEFDSSSPSYN